MYACYMILDPTYEELLGRSNFGRELRDVNNLFRSGQTLKQFTEATTINSLEGQILDKVKVIPPVENVSSISGVLNSARAIKASFTNLLEATAFKQISKMSCFSEAIKKMKILALKGQAWNTVFRPF